MLNDIRSFEALNCTINTTEDCNLRCKYCYENCKKPKNINFEYCKKFIDMMFEDEDPAGLNLIENGEKDKWLYTGRVFDFIGGDSLIDPQLLDKICRYINTKAALTDSLKKGWRLSLSTNGTLFERKDVRDFVIKWKENLSLGISIDGCSEIHDMNRVFTDGTGTMSTIMKWWDWLRGVEPSWTDSTKSTCSKNSIPYLYDSLVFMHEKLGIRFIHQNFIMEDTGCTEDDYKILDEQMEKCINYVFNHRNELCWTMIHPKDTPSFSGINNEDFFTKGRCGSGRMPCLSIDGNIYPCFRWLPHTQSGDVGVMCVGNIFEGMNHKENFNIVSVGAIRANCTKEEKCRTCDFEADCPYCIGGCYAENHDFIRTTHICEITKIVSKWGRKYWEMIGALNEENR